MIDLLEHRCSQWSVQSLNRLECIPQKPSPEIWNFDIHIIIIHLYNETWFNVQICIATHPKL